MLKVILDPAYSVLVLALVLLVAALVTPADPLSMLLVGLPVYFVYLCVMIAARARSTGGGTTNSNSREERIV